MIENVTLIGAGNVAHHLGQALHASGMRIAQIYSRNYHKAKELAELVSAEALSEWEQLKPCDLVVIAVSDQAIPEVAALLSRFLPSDTLVVHTSGATPSAIIASHFQRYGVFYPPQTFSIGRELDFSETPICIHAGNEEDMLLLEELGKRIARSVFRIDDMQRRWLHLSAVLVNNFPNHLYTLAEQVLQDHQLPFELLKPLILETARKVQDHSPAMMQTGPAHRGDQATMEAHLRLLEEYPGVMEIYRVISRSIGKE